MLPENIVRTPKMANNLLLVWHCIGEQELKIYSMPGNHPNAEDIKTCHNIYINGDEIPEDHFMYRLNDLLDEESFSSYLVYDNSSKEGSKDCFTLTHFTQGSSEVDLVVCGWVA